MPRINRYLARLFPKKVFLVLLIVLCCVVLSACQVGIDKGGSQSYAERNASCWTCQFFGYVYRSLALVSQNTAETLCSSSITLMVAFLALWLVFYMGKNLIFTMTEPDYKSVWGMVIKTLAKACLVGIVLSSVDRFYFVVNMIYIPIVELWMFFAMEILKIDVTDSGELFKTLKDVEIATDYRTEKGIFPESLAKQIETIIYAIQMAFDMGISIGMALLTTGKILGFFLAWFVMYVFFYLSITFPLYFIDAVIRFGLAMIIMPLVFVAWVLPLDGCKTIVTTFFKYIMGTGAQFFSACMFTAFAVSVAQGFLNQTMGIGGTAAGQSIGDEMTRNMMTMKAPALLLFTMCFYLLKLAERVPDMGAAITATESGGSILGEAISKAKQFAKQLLIMATGVVSGGAATAISLADQATQQAGSVASGGADQKDEGGGG